MYAVKNWNEEVIKWLALAMVLGMVGLAVMSGVVGDAWAVFGYYLATRGAPPEAGLAVSLIGVYESVLWGAAVGAAFGLGAGAIAGAVVGA